MSRGDTYDSAIAGDPFDAYMANREAAYLRDAIPRLVPRDARYLDFACGTGRVTATVAPLVGESTGVDVSESMLSEARRKCPSTRFVCADLTQKDADLGQFDLATSFRFFGNAEDDLRVAALRSLGALVRKGGLLVINNHRNPNSISAVLHQVSVGARLTDLTYGKLKRMLRDHGFRIVHARAIGFWIVRAKLQTSAALNSRAASVADRVFRHRIWAPFAPDCIIVARRHD